MFNVIQKISSKFCPLCSNLSVYTKVVLCLVAMATAAVVLCCVNTFGCQLLSSKAELTLSDVIHN